MPAFDGSSGSIHYEVREAADPRAVVLFLHGFGEHGGLYQRYAEALNAAGITLVTLDHRGHGRSEGPRGDVGSLDGLVADAERLYELVVADAAVPVVLQGHSLGSVVAAVLAIKHPAWQQALVLSGAPLKPPVWLKEVLDTPGAQIDLDAEGLATDPDYLSCYLSWLENDPLAFTEADAVAAFRASLIPGWNELSSGVSKIAVPTLIVHGADDEVAPLEDTRQVAAQIPSSEVTVWERSRHDVLNDVEHAEVAATIIDFIDRAIASSAG